MPLYAPVATTLLAVLATVFGQVNPHDEEWIHASKQVEEALQGHSHMLSSSTLLETSAEQSTGTARVLRELAAAESAVASQLRGHPDVLGKEAVLLHQASDMALRAGEAGARQLELRVKMKQEEEAMAAVRANVSTVNVTSKKKPQVNATDHASVKASSAAALLEGHAGVSTGTVQVLRELKMAEQKVSEVLRGHPVELKQETKLLHQASQMALRAGEAQASAMQLRHHLQASSKSTLEHTIISAQAAEASLYSDGLDILRQAKDVKADVMDAIGQQDPATASKVQSLMDSLSGNQTKIMKSEEKLSKAIHAAVALEKTQQSVKKGKKTTFAQAHTFRDSTSAQQLQRIALAEAKLARNGNGILNEMSKAKVAVAKALRGKDGDEEWVVERLLSSAQKDQTLIIRAEKKMSNEIQDNAQGKARQHGSSSTNSGMAKAFLGFARQEDKLAQDGANMLKDVQQIENQVQNALETRNATTAKKVEKLMREVEQDQNKVVQTEKAGAALDKKLAAERLAKDHTKSTKPSGKSGSLAQKKTLNLEASTETMLTGIAETEYKLRKLQSRRNKLTSEGRHLLAETAQTEAAIEEQLGDTKEGEAIAELLDQAQAQERKAVRGNRAEAALTKRDVQTVQNLERTIRSEQHKMAAAQAAHQLHKHKMASTHAAHQQHKHKEHRRHNHRAAGSLTQRSAQSLRRSRRSQRQRHLRALARRKAHLHHRSRQIADEEFEDELDDTRIGLKMERMLQRARKEEARAMRSARREVVLAKTEAHKLATLEKELSEMMN